MRALERLAISGLFLIIVSGAVAAPGAEEILAKARTAAAAGQKNIFLLFDASW